MSGLIKLTITDPEIAENPQVQAYLREVEGILEESARRLARNLALYGTTHPEERGRSQECPD